jgi:hypothetical protein
LPADPYPTEWQTTTRSCAVARFLGSSINGSVKRCKQDVGRVAQIRENTREKRAPTRALFFCRQYGACWGTQRCEDAQILRMHGHIRPLLKWSYSLLWLTSIYSFISLSFFPSSLTACSHILLSLNFLHATPISKPEACIRRRIDDSNMVGKY